MNQRIVLCHILMMPKISNHACHAPLPHFASVFAWDRSIREQCYQLWMFLLIMEFNIHEHVIIQTSLTSVRSSEHLSLSPAVTQSKYLVKLHCVCCWNFIFVFVQARGLFGAQSTDLLLIAVDMTDYKLFSSFSQVTQVCSPIIMIRLW